MSSPLSSSAPRPQRRGLPWFPLLITLAAVVAVVWLRSLPELERNLKSWLTAAVPLLAVVLNLLWLLVTPRFSWRLKMVALLGVAILVGGGRLLLRVDGTADGTGLPRLAWRYGGAIPGAKVLPVPVVVSSAPENLDDPRLTQAADVPQFFGPRRDGRITGARLDPDWQGKPPVEIWRQPIGLGWSAFAVVGGRAYTHEQRGEEEMVTCYHLLTGKLLWTHANAVRFSQWQSGDGPHATPTVQAGRVYAYGATGLLSCLEAKTGRLVWQRNVLEENGQANIEWGTSSSPLVADGRVMVTGGRGQGPVLFAYDAGTGEPLWKAGADEAAYSSPQMAELAGRKVILSNNARALLICDPADGRVLLDYAWGGERWPKASQVLVLPPDRVFLSAGYGMGCRMLKLTSMPEGGLEAEELWTGLKMKTQFNSPAERGGFAYGLDDGRLACLDLATGERLWKEGRFASGQTLLVDDLVLVQNENGRVHLAAATPEGFLEHGQIPAMSSKTWNHPVLAGRYLLVRNDQEAVCYELPVLPDAAP